MEEIKQEVKQEIREKLQELLEIDKELIETDKELDSNKQARYLLEEAKSLAIQYKQQVKHEIREMMTEIEEFQLKFDDFCDLSIRKGVNTVNIRDDNNIPEKYMQHKVIKKPDLKLLKRAIELGRDIEGVELVKSKPTLIINYKTE